MSMRQYGCAAAAGMAFALLVSGAPAEARDQLQIVGSSTVFPFSTAVAERFGQKSGFSTPVVESTGSGGGMKLFCQGSGTATPDITNASRRIKKSEFDSCLANGVTPVEVLIGYDGIVMSNSRQGVSLNVSTEQIFLALARNIASGGSVVPNPHRKWSDIDPALPDIDIVVYGPPPTSGTRDAFVELVMEAGCENLGGLNEDDCHEIREDGAFIEAGENDNLIVQKLGANPQAFGIFGFSFLDQNADRLQGARIDDVEPTFEHIASGDYPVSRPLFFYVKKEHDGVVPGLGEFVAEFTSEGAWGDDGYLAEKGLIPLPDTMRMSIGDKAGKMQPLAM